MVLTAFCYHYQGFPLCCAQVLIIPKLVNEEFLHKLSTVTWYAVAQQFAAIAHQHKSPTCHSMTTIPKCSRISLNLSNGKPFSFSQLSKIALDPLDLKHSNFSIWFLRRTMYLMGFRCNSKNSKKRYDTLPSALNNSNSATSFENHDRLSAALWCSRPCLHTGPWARADSDSRSPLLLWVRVLLATRTNKCQRPTHLHPRVGWLRCSDVEKCAVSI